MYVFIFIVYVCVHIYRVCMCSYLSCMYVFIFIVYVCVHIYCVYVCVHIYSRFSRALADAAW